MAYLPDSIRADARHLLSSTWTPIGQRWSSVRQVRLCKSVLGFLHSTYLRVKIVASAVETQHERPRGMLGWYPDAWIVFRISVIHLSVVGAIESGVIAEVLRSGHVSGLHRGRARLGGDEMSALRETASQ